MVAELISGPCTFLLALGQVLTNSTLVVGELKSGSYTFLLILGYVLTLPWWWQSIEVVLVPSDLSCDKC